MRREDPEENLRALALVETLGPVHLAKVAAQFEKINSSIQTLGQLRIAIHSFLVCFPEVILPTVPVSHSTGYFVVRIFRLLAFQ